MPTMGDSQELQDRYGVGTGCFRALMITSDPAFVEAAGYAGYDFVLLDMEHAPGTFENLQNLIRAANVAGVCLWCAFPGERTLDRPSSGRGCRCSYDPQIDTAEQARIAVSAAKFSPAAAEARAASSAPPPTARCRGGVLHAGAGHGGDPFRRRDRRPSTIWTRSSAWTA